MDSITRIKEFINRSFPQWEKIDFSTFDDKIDFRQDWSELYKIDNEEIVLISYTNISITGTDREKPQLRVFLDEYKKPFYFAKKYQLRYYLFSIFTKDDEMAKGLDNFNPKEYIISIETNLDTEGSRRDLRSIYDYANNHLNGRKFLKCSRANYKADINQASFIFIGTPDNPDKEIFESFINIFDSRPYLNSTNEPRYHIDSSAVSLTDDSIIKPYLTALRTKPFMLLAGISGTGKSRIVRKLAQASTTQKYENAEDRWKDNRPENFELIQVKPNWHNSMDVVGYYSNVAKRYEFPPFIDFIVKAWQDLETPYFLCLDEMNLAPVEQYFAEFLSAIESRSFDADGNYVTDPIIKPFKKFGEKEGKAMLVQLFGVPDPIDKNPLALQFFEKGLTLPKNLLVMGTVNMDETTFSFSRKVLDRAMSVVMNEVDYEGFFNGDTENDVAEMDEATRNLLIDRPIRGLEAENNEADAVKEYLTKINEKLNDTPFKLGYRAANEALLYVSAAHKFNPDADIHVALDEFTMMKILSRIEGDKRSIGNLLDELKEVITNDYPKSNEKLEKMAETLKNKQFVSYWT
jgi:hypothetical protein